MSYLAITPYLVPPQLPKRVNVGDGFVLGACEKLIGERASGYLSPWQPLTPADIDRINQHDFLLVAGTNTLKDDFTLCAGFTRETLNLIKVPVVLMAMGHYGIEANTRGMSPGSVQLLEALLERFPYISVRCDRSAAYLRRTIPQKSDAVLMTSCSVAFPVDGVDKGFARKAEYDTLAVTITDRAYVKEQLPILAKAPDSFPARRRVLALHQDINNAELQSFAKKLGYEVFVSPDYEQFIDLYKNVDIHFGNRVHAHLKCLSMGVPSFLAPFDLRQVYFAESLDFPIVDQLPSPVFSTYDFQRYKTKIAAARPAMDRFVAALPTNRDRAQ